MLCDGGKPVLVAAGAAMGDSRSRSHCHHGMPFDGEVTPERPNGSVELKKPVDDLLHVL